jgi:hypothetical protein
MVNVSISAIVPLLGDNRTQRGHHQIDVNDPMYGTSIYRRAMTEFLFDLNQIQNFRL